MSDATEKVIDEVNGRHGSGTLMRGDARGDPRLEVYSTTYPTLDEALGVGGWPRARVLELTGEPQAGKTVVGLRACGACQRAGGTAALVDLGHTLDVHMVQLCGVDGDKLLVAQPDSGAQGLEVAAALAKSGAVDLVVFDCGPGPITSLEDGDGNLSARLLSQALRALTATCARTRATALFLTRRGPDTAFGRDLSGIGNGLRFYASARVELLAAAECGEDGDRMARVVKNKLAAPFRTAEFGLWDTVTDGPVTS